MHFLGGAFVGAAPQLAYRLFLESLASRGVLVSEEEGLRVCCQGLARPRQLSANH